MRFTSNVATPNSTITMPVAQAHTLPSVSVRGPLNEFGYLLRKYCERQNRPMKEVARLAGIKSTSRIYYAIRASSDSRRKTPLRVDELLAIANALKLSVEGQEELVITAQLAAAPERLRLYVRRMEEKLRQ